MMGRIFQQISPRSFCLGPKKRGRRWSGSISCGSRPWWPWPRSMTGRVERSRTVRSVILFVRWRRQPCRWRVGWIRKSCISGWTAGLHIFCWTSFKIPAGGSSAFSNRCWRRPRGKAVMFWWSGTGNSRSMAGGDRILGCCGMWRKYCPG